MKSVCDPWIIKEKELAYSDRSFHESVFSLGNGYMGVRGFNEEDNQLARYEACTYIAGIFDYFLPRFTDMVNTPNFWKSGIRINGQWFCLDNGSVLEYEKELDMRKGIIRRDILWENSIGNKTRIETVKFLSKDDVHQAVLSIRILPLNYSGEVEIETGIDADVCNCVIPDDQMKDEISLFEMLREENKNIIGEDILTIKLRTMRSGYTVCEGFGLELLQDGSPLVSKSTIKLGNKSVSRKIIMDAAENHEYQINKFIGIWTSRDTEAEGLEAKVVGSCRENMLKGYPKILDEQYKAWERIWNRVDIGIVGDDKSQKALRFNIFQLIQTNSENDPGVSIGARGIMHSRYKGCYFWDTDIFMLPFYLYTNPNAARNLLLYRYNTLPGAERNAREQNLEGARYPWMSSIDGSEQCDTWDIGLSEVHITADVAYAFNQYYNVTGDLEFMVRYGLEVLIKTARYWKSRFTYDRNTDQYNMLFVKGPNEYGGVTINNTFTTMMANFNMLTAMRFVEMVRNEFPGPWAVLKDRIGYEDSEAENWADIIQKAVINYDTAKQLYIEDEHFYKLEPVDIAGLKDNDKALYRKICFDRLQRLRILKQADVLLLMHLLPTRFTQEEMMNAWNFYEPITVHDSSLSYGTHAAVAARLGLMKDAYHYFTKSVNLDLGNLMDNTGKEGIHFAALGASWQAVVNGFAGIMPENGELKLSPMLPEQWKELNFKLLYKGNLIKFRLFHNKLRIILEDGISEEVSLWIRDKKITICRGLEYEVEATEGEEYLCCQSE
ncbi:MAG: hypothetical protein N2484_13180 [Clostridia bacterium]|nr:hypothetical protein [Clostridia bacterium]